MRLIDVINAVADAPDPTERVRALVEAIRRRVGEVTPAQNEFLAEMDEKAGFIAAAIVSGGHVHEMSVVFEGVAGSA